MGEIGWWIRGEEKSRKKANEKADVGKETRSHLATHAYRVIDAAIRTPFEYSWNAEEEELLLQAQDAYGIGNWEAIADHVGTKVKEECEKHYVEYYLNTETYPLPVKCERM